MASITLCSVNKEPLSPTNLTTVGYNKDETRLPRNILKTSKKLPRKPPKKHIWEARVCLHIPGSCSKAGGERSTPRLSLNCREVPIPGKHRQWGKR